jgi:hypothetical protein
MGTALDALNGKVAALVWGQDLAALAAFDNREGLGVVLKREVLE